jgi:hypothetical protein
MKRILIVCGIIAFLLLTFFKLIGNGLGDKGFPSSPCRTPGEAKRSFTYVCPAFIEPKVIDYKGHRTDPLAEERGGIWHGVQPKEVGESRDVLVSNHSLYGDHRMADLLAAS